MTEKNPFPTAAEALAITRALHPDLGPPPPPRGDERAGIAAFAQRTDAVQTGHPQLKTAKPKKQGR